MIKKTVPRAFYEYYNNIKIKAPTKFQISCIINCLKLLEKKGIVLKKRYIKTIDVISSSNQYQGFFYFGNKKICINKAYVPVNINKQNKKSIKFLCAILMHEITHAYDGLTNKISNIFFNDYKYFLNKALNITENEIFEIKDSKSYLYNFGVDELLNSNNKLMSFKKQFDIEYKTKIELPTAYSLSHPCEFTAEIISAFVIQNNSIRNLKLRKKIKKILKEFFF